MIVKNEAERIRETLESVKTAIDSWCILDTGSTDGTQDIIRDVFKDIVGQLHEEPIITYADTGFIDFAATRNRGLELAGTDEPFLLLLNGDDTLQNGDALKEFCKANLNGQHGGYYIKIVGCPRGEYDSSRLMRTSVKWRYSLPTHEVLHGEGLVGGRVPVAQIYHVEDPWEKRISLWERDAKILESWLKNNPTDTRAIFYLAQTFECLGNHKKALQYYKQRIPFGGWEEEVYEAYRRVAQCMGHLGEPWEKVQQAFLDTHASLPRRIEPIFQIAEYWFKKDNHALAYLFASRGLDVPLPTNDAFFVDREMYEWRLADIVATSAFYIGEKKVGRKAAHKAFTARPNDMRLRRNYHFYAQSLNELTDTRYVDLNLPLESGWTACNPSIHIGKERRAVIRTVNYKISPTGNYTYQDGSDVIKTRNFIVKLDQNYQITHNKEILDLTGTPRSNFPVKGFEDCRLFYKNKYYLSCTVRDLTEEGLCETALLELDNDFNVKSLKPLRGPWSNTHQKNWKPLVKNNQISWIYSTNPLLIIGENLEIAQTPHPGALLGSTQAIYTPNGWLWLDHEVSHNGQGYDRIYLHRFVLANHALTAVIGISEPFFFQKLGVEFCPGLALDGSNLIMSFSVKDASATLAIVPFAEALKLIMFF